MMVTFPNRTFLIFAAGLLLTFSYVTPASAQALDLPISTAIDSQGLSQVVYEYGQDRFLVVWNDLRNNDGMGSTYEDWAVYGQFVNSTGSLQGGNFAIAPVGVEYRSFPVLAHDAATARTMVVWQNIPGASSDDIYGRMINADGTFYTGVIPIAASSDSEMVPALAFDPILGRYLVAWINATGPNYLVYGQLLNSDGVLQGSPFLICAVSSGKLELTAAAATGTGRFLVAWRDYRGVDIYSIRGQLVNNDGTLYGGEINIADATGNQIMPVLAYDSVNSRFLATWSDTRQTGSYEIFGQLIAADGLLIGPNFFISLSGGYPHALAFNTSSSTYLLTFLKAGLQINGRYLAADGTVLGADFPIPDVSGSQGSPHLAYNSQQGMFLTTWSDGRNASYDIYGDLVPPGGGDCGITIETGTGPQVITCEPSGPPTSQLRIYKNGEWRGIKLVPEADPNASKLRIQTPAGVKALRKQ